MQEGVESGTLLGNVAGFSLHAGVSAKADERDKLERLCGYIARPPVSIKRLSLTVQGNAMTWMQCLKRAFKIDIDICEVCKGPAKVSACITDPVTINKILNHLQLKQRGQIGMLPASRAPPVRPLFD